MATRHRPNKAEGSAGRCRPRPCNGARPDSTQTRLRVRARRRVSRPYCALRALEDKDEDSAEECLMRAIMSSILYSRTLRLRSFFASLSVDCIPKPSYGHGEDNVAKSQRGKEDQRTYYEECGGRPRVGPGLEHGHS